MNLDKYRIRRVDSRNMTIQKREGKRWVSISYHGNSLNSLISGLYDLIIAQYIPDNDNLLDALAELKLAHISGLEFVEELVKRDLK